MAALSYERASDTLRALGGFERLLEGGQQYYSAPELSEMTQALGLGIARNTMLRWIQESGQGVEVAGVGWRIRRDAAVILLAGKIARQGDARATNESAG